MSSAFRARGADPWLIVRLVCSGMVRISVGMGIMPNRIPSARCTLFYALRNATSIGSRYVDIPTSFMCSYCGVLVGRRRRYSTATSSPSGAPHAANLATAHGKAKNAEGSGKMQKRGIIDMNSKNYLATMNRNMTARNTIMALIIPTNGPTRSPITIVLVSLQPYAPR